MVELLGLQILSLLYLKNLLVILKMVTSLMKMVSGLLLIMEMVQDRSHTKEQTTAVIPGTITLVYRKMTKRVVTIQR